MRLVDCPNMQFKLAELFICLKIEANKVEYKPESSEDEDVTP